MAVPNRMSSMRHTSIGGAQQAVQSPALVARINEKKAELENLKQLKDLSANLADQMQALENKLATLSDGTEAVLSNWHSVLQAINMASMKAASTAAGQTQANESTEESPLPETLVRIPAQISRQKEAE